MTTHEHSALHLVLEKLRKAEGCAERKELGGVQTYLSDARLRLAKVLGVADSHLPPKR